MKQSKESFMTIEQVCEFIMNTQDRSNNFRDSNKFKIFAFPLNPKKNEQVTIFTREIFHLKEYFNLRNLKVGSQIKLFSSVILKLISLN
jgi:hypothetical protein